MVCGNLIPADLQHCFSSWNRKREGVGERERLNYIAWAVHLSVTSRQLVYTTIYNG